MVIVRVIVLRLAAVGGPAHAEPLTLAQILRQSGRRRQQRREQGEHTQDGGQGLPTRRKAETLLHLEILEDPLSGLPVSPQRLPSAPAQKPQAR